MSRNGLFLVLGAGAALVGCLAEGEDVGVRSDAVLAEQAPTTDRALAADLDGDGRDEMLIFRPSNGRWYARQVASGDRFWPRGEEPEFGLYGDVPMVGDVDGDGRDDLAIYRPAEGRWRVESADGSVLVDRSWGGGADVPMFGDVDGDGLAELVQWRPGTGRWYAIDMWGRRTWQRGSEPTWGLSTDRPALADLDGDGAEDLVQWRASSRRYYGLRFDGGRIWPRKTEPTWGIEGDVPVLANVNATAAAELVVWRPSNGVWYAKSTAGEYLFARQWGRSTDVPVVGDFDGDGRADLIVYRPATATWHARSNASGTPRIWAFGDEPRFGQPEADAVRAGRMYRTIQIPAPGADGAVTTTDSRMTLAVAKGAELGTLQRVAYRYADDGAAVVKHGEPVSGYWYRDGAGALQKRIVTSTGLVAGTLSLRPDGSASMAFDVDLDGEVDLMERVGPDLSQTITVAIEGPGREILEEVAAGRNFLCALRDHGFAEELAAFGDFCSSGDSASGGAWGFAPDGSPRRPDVQDQLGEFCTEVLAAGDPSPGMDLGPYAGDGDPVDVDRLTGGRSRAVQFVLDWTTNEVVGQMEEGIAGLFGMGSAAGFVGLIETLLNPDSDPGDIFVAIAGIGPLGGAAKVTNFIDGLLKAMAPDFANEAQRNLWAIEERRALVCEGDEWCEGAPRPSQETLDEACSAEGASSFLSCTGGAPDTTTSGGDGATDPSPDEELDAAQMKYDRCVQRARVLAAWGLVQSSPVELTCEDPRVSPDPALASVVEIDVYCSPGAEIPVTDIEDLLTGAGGANCGWFAQPGPDGECSGNFSGYGGSQGQLYVGYASIIGIVPCDEEVCDPFGELDIALPALDLGSYFEDLGLDLGDGLDLGGDLFEPPLLP